MNQRFTRLKPSSSGSRVNAGADNCPRRPAFGVGWLPKTRQIHFVENEDGQGRNVCMAGNEFVLKRYRAVYLMEGSIRRISFEAFDLDEARRLATKWGLGLEGESTEDPIRATHTTIAPAAFDVVSACRVLGDISRTTLYRLLLRGKLERLPATRKVLVTRRSIERFCSTPTRCETIGR
jgi:hypothetical protein